MHLLRYAAGEVPQPRGSWRLYRHKGKRTVAIVCPACGRTVCLPHHRIDLDGFVTEKVECPYRSKGICTLKNADLVLLGWADFWRKKPN